MIGIKHGEQSILGDMPRFDGRIILASGSPRRVELLSRFVPMLGVVPSDVEEEADGPPEVQVRVLAERKARDVGRRCHGLIVAADTLVAVGDAVLGKPASHEEAREMLERLSGCEHVVWTGLCVLETATGRCEQATEATVVRFRPVTRGEVDAYLALDEYGDKAGAYGIQGAAALFVDRIEGDFYNVIGLPLCRLDQLLREFGCGLLGMQSM